MRGNLRGRQPLILFLPLPFGEGKGIQGLGFPTPEGGGVAKDIGERLERGQR